MNIQQKIPEITRAEAILRAEASRTERLIAWCRIVLATLFVAGDSWGYSAGKEVYGYVVPLGILAVDAVYLFVAIAARLWVRKGTILPGYAKYLLISMDFAFVAAYVFFSTSIEMAPDLLAGMAGSICAILIVASALRFSLFATAYASVLALVVTLGVTLVSSTTLVMTIFMVLFLCMVGGIATFLSYRHLGTMQLVVERSRFERFLPRQVVDAVIAGKQDLELGGRELEVSVFFSDIVGFTTLCEKMQPLEVLTMLNDYFSAVSTVVFRYSGTLDKFIGDAVMAIFGAPLSDGDDAVRAVNCALDMREVVQRMNAERTARNLATIKIGIGIHTGTVVAGTLGSLERMEYTVIGDTVNVASRVEGLTRKCDGDILITAATARLLQDAFELNPVGELAVKGREEPVKVFAVKGRRSAGVHQAFSQRFQ